jgi:hypothetical protein
MAGAGAGAGAGALAGLAACATLACNVAGAVLFLLSQDDERLRRGCAARLGAGGVASQPVEECGDEEALAPDAVLNLELCVSARSRPASRAQGNCISHRAELKLGLRCMQRRPDDVPGVLAGGWGLRRHRDPRVPGDELLLRRRRRALLVPRAGAGARGAPTPPHRWKRRRRRLPPRGRHRRHPALPGRHVRAQFAGAPGPARTRRLAGAVLLCKITQHTPSASIITVQYYDMIWNILRATIYFVQL